MHSALRPFLALASFGVVPQAAAGETFEYQALPPLPDPLGFAGMYADSTANGIIAAGGHRFSGGIPWWEGGTKVWSNVIYTFDPGMGKWQTRPETLARPMGDGVSVAWRDGLVCAGGGDSTQA